jgi:hypothetical protein
MWYRYVRKNRFNEVKEISERCKDNDDDKG